jgi:hypothetical protein
MSAIPLIIEPDPDDPGCALVLVDGTVSGRPRRFVLDTGAARTQVTSDSFTSTLTHIGREAAPGIFGRHERPLVTLPDLQVGPTRVSDLPVALGGGGPEDRSLLGMDVLGQHRWTFDFGHATATVDGATSGQQPLRLGAHLHPVVDVSWPGLRVEAVWDSGSGVTIVDEQLVSGHPELFEAPGRTVGTDSTGTQVEGETRTLTGAVIGGCRFAPHRVAVADLSGMNAGLDRPTEIVLGWTTLRQASWVFDFPGRRWSLSTRLP